MVGLRLTGVPPLDHNATIGKRHGSMTTTTSSSSVYGTSDSSVHSVAFTVAGGGGATHAHVSRGTPEGQVVVPPW